MNAQGCAERPTQGRFKKAESPSPLKRYPMLLMINKVCCLGSFLDNLPQPLLFYALFYIFLLLLFSSFYIPMDVVGKEEGMNVQR